MNDLLSLLKDFLPIEIAIIAGIFIYLLLLFKKIAERFISLAEKQASLAESQAQYIQQRLDVVEKTLGISDKAFELQEKRINILEEMDKKKEAEVAQSKEALEVAREELSEMERQYQDAIENLDLQGKKVEELTSAQRRLQQAVRVEAIASLSHSLQTHLQAAIAHADNLKNELPDDAKEHIEDILESMETVSITIANFQNGRAHDR